ncbi:Ig-like domain-containing protein [uncultured Legionella sp.]|uniref:Ig-like domain-containing protein n=1 Tax=uncultured Legionella sp. TaxID=210934 RepID=UPI0026075523|nr:Ig-like domain-containing protein [uncultured Legionella sp.]
MDYNISTERTIGINKSNRSKASTYFRHFIASLLIYCQFFQLAIAAVPPVSQPSAQPSLTTGSPLFNKPTHATRTLNNLSLTNSQLGLASPVNLGVTYSDLTGAFFNAQYVLPLGERFAFGAVGEYGSGQYRLNGTLGYGFTPLAHIKATIDRLEQRLPFQFDTGNIKSRIAQDAYGLRFEQLFDLPHIQGINAGGYWAKADSKYLDPIIFTSNGFNCNGFAAGLQCINYRYIAGANSTGIDAEIDYLLTPSTLVSGALYYDQVRYNTIFIPASTKNRDGIGAGIKVNQLLGDRFKLFGEATAREIYDNYQTGFSWLPNTSKLGVELSLIGQHLVSHNATPDNNSISIQLSLLADGNKHYDKQHHWGNQRVGNLAQWVQTPAVKMKQVLAIAEQLTQLLGPVITSITPDFGPIEGGNTIIITGNNFAQGLLVYIGSQLATQINVLSSTRIQVIVPALLSGTSGPVVDVVVQNPDGQKIISTDGYTYLQSGKPMPPAISSVVDNGGNPIGNGGTTNDTTPTIEGTAQPGTTVTLYDNGNVIGSAIAVATNGNWTFFTPILGNGPHSITATATDGAGNVSDFSTPAFNFTIETELPPSPMLTLEHETSPGITNDGTVNVTGLVPGATWQYSMDEGTTWTAGIGTSFVLPDGTYNAGQVLAAQTDAAGNTSPTGALAPVIVNTLPPPPPTLTLEHETSPGITNDGTVNVTGLVPGAIWQYSMDKGATWQAGIGTSFVLPEGTYNAGQVLAVQTDAAGNTSPTGALAPVIVDTTAPEAPVIDPVNQTDPITGTAEPGTTLTMTFPNGSTAQTTVDSSGLWAIPNPGLLLGDTVSAAVTDIAGNTSPQTTVIVT